MKLYRYKVVFVEFVQRGFFLNFQNFMKGGIQMKSKMNKRISCVVLLAMLVQLMSFGGVLTASAEVSVADNGADYFALAKAYGVYTEAGGNPDGTDIIDGIHIFTGSSANKLVSVDDAQTLAAIDAELFSDKSATVDENGVITPGNMTELAYYAKANGVKYVGPSSDGSYDYVVAVDNTDIARDAWFTSNYWRIPNLWSIKPISSSTDENGEVTYQYTDANGKYNAVPNGYRNIPGYFYFGLSNNVITEADTNLTIVFEYLDIGTKAMNIKYFSTADTAATGSTGAATVTRTNTGVWKTAVIPVTDAKFSTTNKTGLQTSYEFRIECNYADTYIRRLGIVKTADITAPEAESFDVSAVKYIKNGEYSHYAAGGNITTEIDITSATDSTATLYTAVYDKSDALVDVAKSASTALTAGVKATIRTETAVNVPNASDYTFRKYIWTDNLTPAYSVNDDDALVLNADGFYKLAILKWDEYKDMSDAVAFNIYRDGSFIGTTDKTSFYDENATEGTHTYQIIAIDASGNAVYRSNYAIADVITTVEEGVSFTAARKGASYDIISTDNSVNLETKGTADIKHNLSVKKTTKLFNADEALQLWTASDILPDSMETGLTDEQKVAKVKAKGYVANGSDGPVRTEAVTDSYGTTKDAWFSQGYFLVHAGGTRRENWAKMYFNIPVGQYQDVSNLTVFVEYLTYGAAKNRLTLTYANTNSTPNGAAVKSTKSSSQHVLIDDKPQWMVSRFELSDAKLGYKYSSDNASMYIDCSSGVYVSSMFITDKTGNEALSQYAKYKGSNFGYASQDDIQAMYPDGVSLKIEDGEIVGNGMRWYRYPGVNADAYGSIETDGTDSYIQQGRSMVTTDGVESRKQSYVYFDVDDSYLYGLNATGGFYLTLTYKPDFDGAININITTYDDSTGTVGGARNINLCNTVKDETTPWVTETFFVEGHAFTDMDNGSCDFRLFTGNSANDNALKIKEIKIQNLVHSTR